MFAATLSVLPTPVMSTVSDVWKSVMTALMVSGSMLATVSASSDILQERMKSSDSWKWSKETEPVVLPSMKPLPDATSVRASARRISAKLS